MSRDSGRSGRGHAGAWKSAFALPGQPGLVDAGNGDRTQENEDRDQRESAHGFIVGDGLLGRPHGNMQSG
jgi:hypothetical protein